MGALLTIGLKYPHNDARLLVKGNSHCAILVIESRLHRTDCVFTVAVVVAIVVVAFVAVQMPTTYGV